MLLVPSICAAYTMAIGNNVTAGKVQVPVSDTDCVRMPALLYQLNRSLLNTLGGNRFVTLFLGRIDPLHRSFEHGNAGHATGFLLSRSGDITAVFGSTGTPLGIMSDQLSTPGAVTTLRRGGTIILLTDGITESMNTENAYWGALTAR